MTKSRFWALARRMRSDSPSIAEFVASSDPELIPELKNWNEVRKYLYSVGAPDIAFVGARRVWRTYRETLGEKDRRSRRKRRTPRVDRVIEKQEPGQARVKMQRKMAARMFRKGLKRAEIARRLMVSYTTVCRWENVLKTNGARFLLAKPYGRPSKLNKAEMSRLTMALKTGASAYGFPTDKWSISRVVKLIATISGKQYSLSGAENLLKNLKILPAADGTRDEERY
jgi:transposase